MSLPRSLRRVQSLSLPDPTATWRRAHVSRRAGVLVLLWPSSNNELDVLLTVRTQKISYPGDGAFPGGKADSESETPWEVALRESKEEIGLDPAEVEFVQLLPGYVSSKLLMVVPCLAWSPKPPRIEITSTNEVHKVFSVPLSRFLSAEGHKYREGELSDGATVRLHHFDILAAQKRVGDPKYDRVWGLTANILVDCARLVYQREPDFDVQKGRRDDSIIGNIATLEALLNRGILDSPTKPKPRV